jgi:murein DD-endopeptidase MepM/ murein hydrolase activator NlpD
MENGEVIQLGYHYLGGNGLFLRGAFTGDVYYYAHLSAYADGIEVGTPVVAGQVVAYVGDTGNSDVPHLHLGWMPGAGRVDLDALTDAYGLLQDLCG